MTTKPATPLPWTSPAIGRHDHAYMLHACNAYPLLLAERAQLVEALRYLVAPPQLQPEQVTKEHMDRVMYAKDNALALLRSLGEKV